MGHWSEGLVDQAAHIIGGSPDRKKLTDLLAHAAAEVEVLSGRTFRPMRRTSSSLEPNGLPFVDVPDVQVGSLEGAMGVWEVPDPTDPAMATVLQVARLEGVVSNAASTADGLWSAGQLVAHAVQAGTLTRDYVVEWLGTVLDDDQRKDLFRRVMDPAIRFYVPILGQSVEGWWIQIARRLIWVTDETEDEGRLIEMLLDRSANSGEHVRLAATEPIMIVARMTEQPVEWAFTARIWPEGVRRPIDRTWSKLARAIHGHGIPTITCDSVSTDHEIACQVLLKGYWHGYITGDEPALASALVLTYPKQVHHIQRETGAPSGAAAAAMLLEQLVMPGFDPAQGAEATRRYVRRKASIVVMEHRKLEDPDRYPWTHVGISERRFYKLLPLFAEKVNGRYAYDYDEVVARMKAYLDEKDRQRAIRENAMAVLRSHGFGDEAARKWLQRHRPEEAVRATPRRPSQ
ncbi:hypothetical protein ACFWEJ_07125 [Promicromonospora sp. NPDC060204]|uniref:hypothetical protein n=1 Tax=Promicromonospora sp. NPDC060204 TaxID=3347071 RepID=UPI0036557398